MERGRIKNIKRYIDLTMCLFNFEHDYYRNKNLPSIHIGHPFSKLFKHDSQHVYKKYHLDAFKKIYFYTSREQGL
jgi:lipid-A-disaccharide synthase